MGLELTPLTLAEANRFVDRVHRHHGPTVGGKFAIGCASEGEIVGVAIVGRPVARHLDDGWTVEVNRVATDGQRNACSMLYGAAWRAAKAMGYKRIVTYTLDSESGASLRGAGWEVVAEVEGRSWDCPRCEAPEFEAEEESGADRTLYYAIEHRKPDGDRWSSEWSLWFWNDPDPNGGRFRTYEEAEQALSGRWKEVYGEEWEGRIVRIAVLRSTPEPEPEEGEPEDLAFLPSVAFDNLFEVIVNAGARGPDAEMARDVSRRLRKMYERQEERIEALEKHSHEPQSISVGNVMARLEALEEQEHPFGEGKRRLEALEKRVDRIDSRHFVSCQECNRLWPSDSEQGAKVRNEGRCWACAVQEETRESTPEPDSEPEPGVREFYPTTTPGKPEVRIRREPERNEGGASEESKRLLDGFAKALRTCTRKGAASEEPIPCEDDCDGKYKALLTYMADLEARLRSRPSEEAELPEEVESMLRTMLEDLDACTGANLYGYKENIRDTLDKYESLRTKEGDDVT